MLYCDNLMNKQGEYGTYALFPDYAGLFEDVYKRQALTSQTSI